MSDDGLTGGCLCGALRYRVGGVPLWMGYCYCGDCRKASGSGFIPFIGVDAAMTEISGPVRAFTMMAGPDRPSTRCFCATCSSMVFGGVVGESTSFTIYAGSLDDPRHFVPAMAIFDSCRPTWVPRPPGLDVFARMPTSGEGEGG
ncbi:GFA family protein [Zavarzinia sp. CC-PAN008]|uniref:GFA family protein n=1 Tax=Zavarzinia sp. CC-PAN008 TaxID=3243332 RepID=UPI003F7456C2